MPSARRRRPLRDFIACALLVLLVDACGLGGARGELEAVELADDAGDVGAGLGVGRNAVVAVDGLRTRRCRRRATKGGGLSPSAVEELVAIRRCRRRCFLRARMRCARRAWRRLPGRRSRGTACPRSRTGHAPAPHRSGHQCGATQEVHPHNYDDTRRAAPRQNRAEWVTQ